MSRTLLRVTAIAAATVVAMSALSGCSEDPAPVGPGVTIPPSERVTDVAAIALTEEEAERIREECGDATDLPEPGSPCWDALEDVEAQAGSAPPDCSEEFCLVSHSVTDEPGVVTMRLQAPPDSTVCQGSPVCDGFQIPAPLAARVIGAAPPVATTEPEPTESESVEPTETEPEPTVPVEPTDGPTDENTDLPPTT